MSHVGLWPAKIQQRARRIFRSLPSYCRLDCELGLGTGAAAVCRLGVTRELKNLVGWEPQDILEALANIHENCPALLRRATLASSNVTITTVGDGLAGGASPHTNTVESLAHVDDDAHDLTIVLRLQSLADRGQHGVQPDIVDGNVALLLEAVGPLATVLVLGVLPFWSHALLEKMVVRLQRQLRDGGNVVLSGVRVSVNRGATNTLCGVLGVKSLSLFPFPPTFPKKIQPSTHIDAPELLY